jgi:flagellar basal body-associated protein FliL
MGSQLSDHLGDNSIWLIMGMLGIAALIGGSILTVWMLSQSPESHSSKNETSVPVLHNEEKWTWRDRKGRLRTMVIDRKVS